MSEKMTLEQFVEQEHKRLDLFKAYFISNHAKNPKGWPLKMRSADWDEQLMFFDETQVVIDNGGENEQ